MHTTPIRQRSNRGLAMPLALMLLFVMVVLVGALMGIVGQELREVAYTGFDNRALYLADAGIQEMVSQEEYSSPALPQVPPQYYFPADPNGIQPSFIATVIAHNVVNNRRTYLMQSEGISSEGYTRYVDALSLEDTFANYNYAGWTNAPGNYFVSGLMQYNGPVYLGGGSSDPVHVWWQSGDASLFLDKVTVQGTLQWDQPGGGHNAPQSQTDWQAVDSHGSSYFTQVANPISFPPDAAGAVIANEAFSGVSGTTMPAPSNHDVYVNGNAANANNTGGLVTGIYVNGSANINFASTASTETITFQAGTGSNPITNTVTVTVNYSANTTTVVEAGHTSTYTGVPSGPGSSTTGASANGAIFVNGDVTSLSGVVHGQQTVATNDNNQNSSENNVTISGNITYEQDPQTCNCTSTDMLGVIAHNVLVASSAPANLTIEGAVFAGNSYDYNHPSTHQGTFSTDQGQNPQNIPKKGPLLVYGSLVNDYISPLGVFNSSNGQLVNGWADSYTWDSRFKTTSPPFYPSMKSYTIIGWTDCGNHPC